MFIDWLFLQRSIKFGEVYVEADCELVPCLYVDAELLGSIDEAVDVSVELDLDADEELLICVDTSRDKMFIGLRDELNTKQCTVITEKFS